MKARIAVIAGDGIGPEVVAEGVRVLERVGQKFYHEFPLQAAPFGYLDHSGFNQAYFDEIRVSSGARWTANFTPATQEYTVDGNTQLLWHFDDYGLTKLPSTNIIVGESHRSATTSPNEFGDGTQR